MGSLGWWLSLWNFLGSWFPDADYEGFDTDEEVVQSFLQTGNVEWINTVREQCERVLALDKLPVEKVSNEANRHFEDEQECRSWLVEISKALKSEYPPLA